MKGVYIYVSRGRFEKEVSRGVFQISIVFYSRLEGGRKGGQNDRKGLQILIYQRFIVIAHLINSQTCPFHPVQTRRLSP